MKSALALLLFTGVLARAQDISGAFQPEAVAEGRIVVVQQEALSPTASLFPLSPNLPFAPQAPDRPSSPAQPLSPTQLMAGAGTHSVVVSGDTSLAGATLLQSPGSTAALSARILDSVQAITVRLDGLSISVGGAGFR